ncbi:MAG: inosine-5-monophosphate dehydrogenase [Pseudomonadota bacterium]|jgi:IMP dehydrogenase
MKIALTYDDVLLMPNYSEVVPREVSLRTRLRDGFELGIPLLAAAMDTLSEHRAAIAMARLGGLAVIHKNLSIARQAEEVTIVKAEPPEAQPAFACRDAQGRLRVAAAVGPGADCDERAAALVAAGVDLLVVDTAHGHSKNVLDAVRRLRARFPALALCAGNVATPAAVAAIADAGADVVKVGIGPGSICTTRIVAGVGVPQMTAVLECSAVARDKGVTIIADGGIKHSGDIVKAMAGGADAVMVGSLLAGTDETPGDFVVEGGVRYKAYRGMGSLGAMAEGSKDRYFQEQTRDADKLVPEGVEARVPSRGPLGDVVHQLMGGLRAGMGYNGAVDFKALREGANFVQITTAGLRESHVHGVSQSRPAPNYAP